MNHILALLDTYPLFIILPLMIAVWKWQRSCEVVAPLVKVYWRPRLYALDRTGKRYWQRIQVDVYDFKAIEVSKKKLQ